MADDKVPVVRRFECYAHEGMTHDRDGSYVLATDYEAAISQMKSATEYARSLEKLIDWYEMTQHYGVSVAEHNLGKRPTPRLPRPDDYAYPAEEVDHDR